MSIFGKTAWTVSGVVDAPPDRVWQALLGSNPNLSRADKEAIARQPEKASQLYTITKGEPGEGKIYIEVDKRTRSLAIQGEWWYRGVYSVQPRGKGSLLAYTIRNVAPGSSRWMANLVQGPQAARGMKGQLRDLLNAIGERLGVATHLVE
jgi:hypothetical protein